MKEAHIPSCGIEHPGRPRLLAGRVTGGGINASSMGDAVRRGFLEGLQKR